MSNEINNLPYDPLLTEIADYVDNYVIGNATALDTARHCLVDSMACALDALDFEGCKRLLGPVVPGAAMKVGARVPGTQYMLDPVTAAFNIGAMVRWTDFNDTWTAPQTTHPSDDVGAILAVADYLSRVRMSNKEAPFTLRVVLEAMVKAHEIQGVLGMGQSLGPYGIDHTLLVKVACAAVVAKMLGGTREHILAATSLAFLDPPLCVHRMGSNTGPRKSWAGGEAASHAVRLAMMAVGGEPGYPQAAFCSAPILRAIAPADNRVHRPRPSSPGARRGSPLRLRPSSCAGRYCCPCDAHKGVDRETPLTATESDPTLPGPGPIHPARYSASPSGRRRQKRYATCRRIPPAKSSVRWATRMPPCTGVAGVTPSCTAPRPSTTR